MISAIVAVDKNNGIGYKGDLLVHIPDDLKRFKELTENNIVIMGRKTYESLPNRPLPNRTNIVISNSASPLYGTTHKDGSIWMNMETAKIFCVQQSTALHKNIFIIGGASIYKQFINFYDRIYLTRIHKEFDNVDSYFPELHNDDYFFRVVEKSDFYYFDSDFYDDDGNYNNEKFYYSYYIFDRDWNMNQSVEDICKNRYV